MRRALRKPERLAAKLPGGKAARTRVPGFRDQVLRIVSAVPRGRVIAYGDVATLAGSPRAARAVGMVLRGLPDGSKVPWHRVVSADGAVPSRGRETWAAIQRGLLEAEGVPFGAAGKVEMAQAAVRGRLG